MPRKSIFNKNLLDMVKNTVFSIKTHLKSPLFLPENVEPVQNSVSFAQALAVFRPTAYKTAFFSGCCCKAEVLQQPL
jgi:hypothetical protein